MPTNNVLGISASGIVAYDGAGAFSGLTLPLGIANGGQGNASLTSYAVLCGGTTTTAAVQPVSSVGNSGDILTSNGASALPTFNGFLSGYNFTFSTFNPGNPANATSYFLSTEAGILTFISFTASGGATTRFYCPAAGTLKVCVGAFEVAGTLATSENCTLAIRKNNSTDTNVSTTIQLTASVVSFNNTGLSISLSAGDYIEFKFVAPTWVTKPTSVTVSISVYIS